ncbi:M23 family metallopeptidase [Streptomyces sp. 7-21]|uniref:M23 family metallopeptidase n=1 Tax=Streptomyces sp. 7-21 TaxID=2802283 RepID=UPI00191E5DFF|nr:M23 family metallopeptidase [Streptomyces sp. 7-21]MBL1067457.1 M23 family metallopeptidase [Streptomyces sp. 7-21]
MRTTIKALSVLSRWCFLLVAAEFAAGFFWDTPRLVGWVLITASVVFRMLAALLARRADRRAPAREPAEVAAPVTGTWSALNSPADNVPSHGTRAYGQAYAIDVVAEGDGPGRAAGETAPARPGFGWWPVVRRNRDFPAYGQPLLAVADATVVTATDWQRDHLSRNSYPVLAYFFLEAILRDLLSPRLVVGNHLVLDLGDGTYALYAHLKHGSLTVRPGDRVTAGQRLASCGNSGNTTEPHLHFQLMDGPDLDTARGVPFSWRGIGVPAAGERFTAAAPAA